MSEDGQAFPTGDHTHGGQGGMTQRQWYAGKAITGIFAGNYEQFTLDQKIALAFRTADKMIKLEEDGE